METPKLIAATQAVAQQIESRLKDLVPVSSGKLRDSIRAHVDEQGNLIDISIDGESYFKYVDQGREAGSFPPLDAIQEWATKRNIEPKAAFVIARSIAEKGIVGKHITEDLEKDGEFGVDNMAEAFADDVEQKMSQALNEIFG